MLRPTTIKSNGGTPLLQNIWELLLIIPLTVGLIKLTHHYLSTSSGWIIPGLLTLIPIIRQSLSHESYETLGLKRCNLRLEAKRLLMTSLIGLPLGIFGLILINTWQWPLAAPTLSTRQQWFYWGLAQPLYVAFPEELFFRGYVQGRLHQSLPQNPTLVILLSAFLFGTTHVLILNNFLAWFTPLPGLLFAWLYWRSKTLWGPIIFHALCNLTYGLTLTVILTL